MTKINSFKQTKILGSRLHRKVLFMMIAVSVLPIIFLGFLALYSLKIAHNADVANIEENFLRQKIEEIKSFFSDIIADFELKVAFEQVTDIQLGEQHFLLREFLKENPNLEEVSFISLSGKETARLSRFYPNGVPKEELQNQSKIESFLLAKNGTKYISPIYKTLKGPMITVYSPVYNRNNIVISVLTGEINLSGLEKIINKSFLGSAGYVYLVDQDGFLVASSRQLTNNQSLNLSKLGFIEKLLSGENFLGVEKQKRYRSFWGEKVVSAGALIPEYNLGIVAEWPTTDADRIVNVIRNQIMIFSLAVLFLSLILSLFLANKIVLPIKTLEVGTHLVAEGKFDQPVNISTNDEIEDLGVAFNKMMEGLRRLEELKNEFVFIAAHELRTPVTAIKGYISMVFEKAEGRLDAEIEKFLAEVKKASERLNNLVNDLLQIARSEAGRLEIKVAPTDIIAPIKAVISELKVLADEKSINIIYDAGTLPKVLADPARLKEVMVNLVGNAIKYTLGAGTVTISHEIRGNEIITHVKDTGIGIPKEAQKKLFEKFYRVQDERTREITGTGLGLFIVKQIIEKMGGKIWFESEEGKGSTFSFSLPIA
jgi:signal transduction histidine kinase